MAFALSTTRRQFVGAGLAATILPAIRSSDAFAGDSACNVNTNILNPTTRPEICVSLRETLESAKAGGRKRFQGLTRLDGCLVDRDNKDVFLWGLSEKGQPDLYVDDLIVALRSEDGLYLEPKKEKLPPAISIDPDKEVMAKLREIRADNASDKQRYAALCSRPQTVRVDGMPRDTRVAKVMLDADYRMKQVAQGHARLPMSPPFSGTFANRMQRYREELRSGEARGNESSSRRFWFNAGSLDYGYDLDTVTIRSTRVVLSEEDDADGVTESTRKDDPISKDFACSWTTRMEETYGAEPIWRDLFNVYRHFAFAHAARERKVFFVKEVGNVRALIQSHQIDHVELPTTVPGLGRWETIEHTVGRRRSSIVARVCGGVSLGFPSRVVTAIAEPGIYAGINSLLWRAMTSARPNQASLSWPITPAILQAASEWHDAAMKEREALVKEIEGQLERHGPKPFGTQQWYGVGLLAALLAFGCGVGWFINRRPAIAMAATPRKTSSKIQSDTTDPVSRNALCPCNSGKRYKHCHGAYTS